MKSLMGEALPRTGGIRDLMLKGGRHGEIQVLARAALDDPELIEPLAMFPAVGNGEILEDFRVERGALLDRLRAIGAD